MCQPTRTALGIKNNAGQKAPRPLMAQTPTTDALTATEVTRCILRTARCKRRTWKTTNPRSPRVGKSRRWIATCLSVSER